MTGVQTCALPISDKQIVFDTNKTIAGLTADSGPVKSGDRYYFINPTTGQTQYTTDAKTANLISSGQATGNTMLDIANSMIGTNPVAKEYTTTDFGVTAENPVKEIKDSTGTTYYAVFNKDTGTQFIATDRETADKLAAGDSGLRLNANTDTYYDTNENALNAAYYYLAKPSEVGTFTDVNEAMKWNDFLPAGVSIATATPQQIADAKAALQGDIDNLNAAKANLDYGPPVLPPSTPAEVPAPTTNSPTLVYSGTDSPDGPPVAGDT